MVFFAVIQKNYRSCHRIDRGSRFFIVFDSTINLNNYKLHYSIILIVINICTLLLLTYSTHTTIVLTSILHNLSYQSTSSEKTDLWNHKSSRFTAHIKSWTICQWQQLVQFWWYCIAVKLRQYRTTIWLLFTLIHTQPQSSAHLMLVKWRLLIHSNYT